MGCFLNMSSEFDFDSFRDMIIEKKRFYFLKGYFPNKLCESVFGIFRYTPISESMSNISESNPSVKCEEFWHSRIKIPVCLENIIYLDGMYRECIFRHLHREILA